MNGELLNDPIGNGALGLVSPPAGGLEPLEQPLDRLMVLLDQPYRVQSTPPAPTETGDVLPIQDRSNRSQLLREAPRMRTVPPGGDPLSLPHLGEECVKFLSLAGGYLAE